MRMNGKRHMAVGVILALLLAACGGGAGDTTTAAPTTAATGATTTATSGATDTTVAEEGPTELKMALIAVDVIDDPWYTTMLDAMERAKQASPYGLSIEYDWFENISYADAERVIGDLAASGKYGVIVAHSAYGEAVAAVKDQYPDIAFVFSGAGNEPTGGNGFWIQATIHEPAYLSGIAAGLMTQTDVIGVVANFPFPDVNGPVNAFIEGAKSVNPDIDEQVTFIESWWDPVKAKESAVAQMAVGADVLYGVVFGVLAAASEVEDVYGIGDYDDQEYLAPNVVLTSNLVRWDPALNSVIDAWWEHNANGKPYDAPMEGIVFWMAEGGSDIAPLNEAIVPEDVRTAVLEVRDKILSGELVVELNENPPE